MNNVTAVILAGGRSHRMGVSTKAMLMFGGETLLSRISHRIAPQADRLLINGDPRFLVNSQYPVIEDRTDPFSGPLAGLYSALVDPLALESDYILVVPCDSPFVPIDLVHSLLTAMGDADIACARYKGIPQPTFSLWHRRQTDLITKALLSRGDGGFKPLMAELDTVYVDWGESSVNPFLNINTPDDMQLAEGFLCL
ncbi:MAG: molybdenum cofactor guanylyltransferase [Porticoccaceae bacterium]|nr:molybdenum cofactor guanylyltransferase [Porticoccaceae bacterium]MDG1474069.1 molybdenum cofactor guanylyltransferase [Porticoccaceae bacterium]